LFTFAFSLVFAAVTVSADQAESRPTPVPIAAALCSPAINPPVGQSVWNAADDLFEKGRYVAAARAYYQVFRCDPTGWNPIFPLVSDRHQLGPFDAALRQAAAGEFSIAASELHHILKTLPQFGEARFLMGVFQWSAGMHSEARAIWQSVIIAPYFTMPPDYNQTPYVVTEARRLLRWSSRNV